VLNLQTFMKKEQFSLPRILTNPLWFLKILSR